MKRLIAVIAALTIVIPGTDTADAAIFAKPMTQVAQVDRAASGIVLSGNQILVFGNREKNGFAQLVSGLALELSCGVESFVSAATTDIEGNFYLVGAAANPIVGTLPPISGVLICMLSSPHLFAFHCIQQLAELPDVLVEPMQPDGQYLTQS